MLRIQTPFQYEVGGLVIPPKESHRSERRPRWTSTHQRTIHWMPLIRYLVVCWPLTIHPSCVAKSLAWYATHILRIFLKKKLEFFPYYFIKVYVKILAKKFIFTKNNNNSFTIFFYCFKINVTMFNECFCLFFTHWINFKLICMFPWYIKNTTI
jgi:hypothetical protein